MKLNAARNARAAPIELLSWHSNSFQVSKLKLQPVRRTLLPHTTTYPHRIFLVNR